MTPVGKLSRRGQSAERESKSTAEELRGGVMRADTRGAGLAELRK